MEGVLYSSVVLSAKDSPSGEDPTILYVTEEKNFLLCFLHGYNGFEMLKHFYTFEKQKAIEFGVDKARELKAREQ